jgi:exopolyphosphatase/guanosine-5'-triphosphate,3'-diphosphate pyrophosphatase
LEKVAIIDLGCNVCRLVLADIHENGYYNIVDDYSDTVRIGQDMERDGFLKSSRIESTIKTLKNFKKICDANKVDKIIAVASCTLRHAKNQKSFLEEIASVTGFKFKVLTEEEENQYIYRGVINSLDVPKGLIIEVSGNVTTLIYYNRRTIINSAVVPFGAMTLNDLFNNKKEAPEACAEQTAAFFLKQLKDVEWLNELDEDVQLVGVGGIFRNLGKISRMLRKYPLDSTHNYVLPFGDFINIYDMVKVLDLDKRRKIKGLSEGRADIFVSALAQVKAIMEYKNFQYLTISGAGLREGLLFNHALPSTVDKPVNDILTHSLLSVLSFANMNIAHAEHVSNISLQLFKQLRVLHKLPRMYIKVLKTASYLHDIGMSIKFYDHHRHSAYFILNCGLYGISHRDIVLSAYVADAHRKGEVNINDMSRFKDILIPEDFEAVRRLGVILKIAEELDRACSGTVASVTCDVLGDSVILKTETSGVCELEIKEGYTASPEFRKVYKKTLEIL